MDRLTLFADVILPLPVSGTFTYRVPWELNEAVQAGARAVVQFGQRKIYTALIRKIHQTPPAGRVPKYILSVLDTQPIVTAKQFAFWDWCSGYYLCHVGEVMNAALPSVFKLASETRVVMNPGFSGDSSVFTDKEQLLLEALGHRKVIPLSEAARILDLQKVIPVIRTLIEHGAVLLEEELKERLRPKREQILKLATMLQSDENKLREVFDTLEKRAVRQSQALMTFLQITRFKPGEEVYLPRAQLMKLVPKGAAAIRGLIEKGILCLTEEATVPDRDPGHFISPEPILLTPLQQNALDSIRAQWHEKEAVLVHGVTSSGKTALYIHLIREALDRGKQVLYLLPEIALTAQIINRLTKYFGDRVGVYHSRFNEREKAALWSRILDHRVDVILGARSAVFAPFTQLGMVIVDEEHDSSFKQNDPAPRYQARDAALYLAHLFDTRALLGSATPSLESYFNAVQGKFGLVELPERYGDLPLPEIRVVDIREDQRSGRMKSHFSGALLEQLEKTLTNREQAILFQNRRGFSLRLECETCHWIPGCRNCDVTLVYHKKINQLRCHYCGFITRIPEKCPECNGVKIRMKGFGTERVEEDLQILFPDARIVRMDLDTTRSKHAHQKIISDFEERKIDILVGTQMVTKGLDFDRVSTVGILNADNMLSYPDFRSAERSYQLMAQVSGRSGRKNRQGIVFIQTWRPADPVIRFVVGHDFHGMFRQQLAERQRFKYPPYCRLINLRLKHKKPELLNQAAAALAADLRAVFGNRILGPEYPMVSRIMNQYIKQILIKLERGSRLISLKDQLTEILQRFEKIREFSGIRIIVDVDPV